VRPQCVVKRQIAPDAAQCILTKFYIFIAAMTDSAQVIDIYSQHLSVSRKDRERLNGHGAKIVWLTGLSGAGKSTIANALDLALHERGVRTYVLDGDNIRLGLNSDLGFSDADRTENIRRVAEVAKLMLDAGLVVITAFISPFESDRVVARGLVEEGEFIEVFVSTPVHVCEQRDAKGLYARARRGEIANMTGIGSRYEVPEKPEVNVNAGELSVDQCVLEIIKHIH
jgi:bifunctional enzyme CysN/CysC